MDLELEIIQFQASQLLSKKKDITEEIQKHNVARSIIATGQLICTISIMQKPEDPQKEIRLFEELDKLAGVMKKWFTF